LPGERLASGPFHQTFRGDDRPEATLPPPLCAARIGLRLPSNVCGRPHIPSSPTIDRRREVRPTAQLVGSLFAHPEELSDVDHQAQELPVHQWSGGRSTVVGGPLSSIFLMSTSTRMRSIQLSSPKMSLTSAHIRRHSFLSALR
jgi:hypothetical protein